MANFNPINTQEEFDEAIKGRLERERAKFQTELDKMAGLQSTIEGLEKAKSEWGSEKGELNEKIKGSLLHVYKGLGHGAYEEAKDFNQIVCDFFTEHHKAERKGADARCVRSLCLVIPFPAWVPRARSAH